MSGTFDRRPELMILVAVLVALGLGIIASVASCGVLSAAAGNASQRFGTLDGDNMGGSGGTSPEDILEGIMPDDPFEGGNGGSGGNGMLGNTYTDKDVPATMDIEVPELTDDLQACINRDLEYGLGLKGKDVKVTELTKDTVGTPELKNGQVLCTVSGKATIENADGETATTDFTSYYYADDPRADKITWYIFGYDLGSYDLFPTGFKRVSGDPMGIRDYLLDDSASADTAYTRDHGRDAEDA